MRMGAQHAGNPSTLTVEPDSCEADGLASGVLSLVCFAMSSTPFRTIHGPSRSLKRWM